MSLLTDEEQDGCMPSEEQLEAYMAEPDDAIAASLSEKDKRLVAKFILCGRNIAKAQERKTLKAVAKEMDSKCPHFQKRRPKSDCPGCMVGLMTACLEGKMPGEE